MSNSTMQRVVLIGSTGLIGREIHRLLTQVDGGRRYEVLGVSRSDGGIDIEDRGSIAATFERVGSVDHVIVAAGAARFGALADLDDAAFEVGLRSKLMGQVNVVRESARHMSGGGSITLTSGALSHTPIPSSSAVALVNGAIDSFVLAATLDLPSSIRLNVVSPGWLAETRIALGLDPAGSVSAREIAALYLEAIAGGARGRILERRTTVPLREWDERESA